MCFDKKISWRYYRLTVDKLCFSKFCWIPVVFGDLPKLPVVVLHLPAWRQSGYHLLTQLAKAKSFTSLVAHGAGTYLKFLQC